VSRKSLSGTLLDERVVYSLTEVCLVCGTESDWVVQLVQEGILEPHGRSRKEWQFSGRAVHIAMKARRLQRDLDLNLTGVALVLELLDERDALRARVQMLESAGD